MVQSYKHEENPGKFFRSGGHDEYLQNFFKAVIENNPKLLEAEKTEFTKEDFDEFYDKLYENIVVCELGWKGNVSGNWIQKVMDVIANILTLLHDKIFSKKFTPSNYEKQFNEISSKLEVLFENDINFEGDKAEKNVAILRNLTILVNKCLLARSQKGAKHFETTKSLDSFMNKFFNVNTKISKEKKKNLEISEYKNFARLTENLNKDGLFLSAYINNFLMFKCKTYTLPMIDPKKDDFNIQISKLRTVEYCGNLFKEPVKLDTETDEEFKIKEEFFKYSSHFEIVQSLLESLAQGNQTNLSKSNLDLIEEFIDGTIKLTEEQVKEENKANSLTDNPKEKILSTLSNILKSIVKLIETNKITNKNKENLNKVLSIIINTEIKLYAIQLPDLIKYADQVTVNPTKDYGWGSYNTDNLNKEVRENFRMNDFICQVCHLKKTIKENNIDVTLLNSPQVSK